MFITFHSNNCFLLLSWTKFLSGNAQFLYSIWIWKYITKIRHEKKSIRPFHQLLAYDIFFWEILHIKA